MHTMSSYPHSMKSSSSSVQSMYPILELRERGAAVWGSGDVGGGGGGEMGGAQGWGADMDGGRDGGECWGGDIRWKRGGGMGKVEGWGGDVERGSCSGETGLEVGWSEDMCGGVAGTCKGWEGGGGTGHDCVIAMGVVAVWGEAGEASGGTTGVRGADPPAGETGAWTAPPIVGEETGWGGAAGHVVPQRAGERVSTVIVGSFCCICRSAITCKFSFPSSADALFPLDPRGYFQTLTLHCDMSCGICSL